MVYGFGDNQADRSGILAALQAEKNDFDGGTTGTYDVMVYALNEFTSNNIPATDNNIIFLFTDGVPVPSDGQRVCEPTTGPAAQRFLNRRAGLEALDTLNIEVVLIALNFVDPSPLMCLYDHIFMGGFTSADFDSIEAGLVGVLCEGLVPQPEPVCPQASYNLLIILDESGSIGMANYQFTVDFVINLINNEINPNSPLASVAFSNALDMVYGFGDNQADRSGILAALQAEKNDFDGGTTGTYDVMVYALNEFTSNNIPATDNNIIFLFTDGVPVPSDGQRVCEPTTGPAAQRFLNRRAGLEALDTLNIEVVLIALNFVDPSPLMCLYDHIFMGGFTSADFDSIEAGLVGVLCEGLVPQPEPVCPQASYNLLIILDESGSIGMANYQFTVDFVIGLINQQIDPNSPLASVAFGNSNDMVWGFNNDQSSRAGILAALQAERNDFASGGTATFNVMKYAINEFESNNIPPTDNNLIFLFTDGVPTPQFAQRVCEPISGPLSQRYQQRRPGLEGLDTFGIEVIVIALNGFDPLPLSCITDQLFEGDFTSSDFDAIEQSLVNVLCGDPEKPCPCYGDLDPSLTYCLSGCCGVGVLAKTKCGNDFISYGVREDDKSCFVQTNDNITTEVTGLTSEQYYECEAILIEAAKGDNCTISDTIDYSIFGAFKLFVKRISNADPTKSIFDIHVVLYALFALMFVGTIIGLIYLCISNIAAKFGCAKSSDYVNLSLNDEEIVSNQA